MGTKCIVKTYDAVGGPSTSGTDQNGNAFGPTDTGSYVFAGAWPHGNSKLYKAWSTIPWGTPIREESNGSVSVKMNGKWQPLSKFSTVSPASLKSRYLSLYGKNEIPKKWVFNDFGHVTAFVFKDVNNNGVRDKNEPIHDEFIHTTPDDEASTAKGIAFTLKNSHGCVHVKPKDIDEMIAKGYIKKSNVFVVHAYTESTPLGMQCSESAKAPFEVHFYPGIEKIYIFGEL